MQHRARTTREKSSWAVICIIGVVILFGMYWLWQKQEIENQSTATATLPISPVPPSKTVQQPSMDELQASAANIAIPAFEKVL